MELVAANACHKGIYIYLLLARLIGKPMEPGAGFVHYTAY